MYTFELCLKNERGQDHHWKISIFCCRNLLTGINIIFWKQLELSLVKDSYGLFNHRIGVDLDKTEIEFGKFALHRMVVDPKKIWTCLNFRGLLKILLTIKITPNQSTKANLCWNFKGQGYSRNHWILDSLFQVFWFHKQWLYAL